MLLPGVLWISRSKGRVDAAGREYGMRVEWRPLPEHQHLDARLGGRNRSTMAGCAGADDEDVGRLSAMHGAMMPVVVNLGLRAVPFWLAAGRRAPCVRTRTVSQDHWGRDASSPRCDISDMTVLGPPPVTLRRGSIDSGAWRSRIRGLPAAIRATQYLAVGGGRRFRAVQRSRTLAACRVVFLVVAAINVLDATFLFGLGTASVGPAIALDALVMAGALVTWWQLPRRLRHHPDAGAFLVMLGVAISTVASGTFAPALAVQTVGYLLLMPSLIALALPWRTIVHIRWLLAFTLVAAFYLILGPGGRFSASERADLTVVLIASIGASLVGHGLLQRGQIRAFAQMERIRGLSRRAAVDHRELERVHRELERTARIDPLTGAGNRRRLSEDLLAIRSQIDRFGTTYGLMEIDLDHFKGINDRLGHLAGDDVLRRVVEAVQAAARASDSVYRYGGEEFVVIIPTPDREHLLAAAERLRTAVLDLGIEHPENASVGVVSISIGATLISDETLAFSDDQWFWVVDRAMYSAKAGGRNQVRLATALSA